mmetsp:Transcript_29187/g.87907  ORF Transcript_29187/g.87907 Transcript_29187/m.87907 type:complete len:242 (+) Transcript_29187:297-1022(+)
MSPWLKRTPWVCRRLTMPSRWLLMPVSSSTSRCAVSAKFSPGSARPPGSFQLPWNWGRGATRSWTISTSPFWFSTTPPTPIWVKPWRGKGLGVSGSHRVRSAYSGLAWWYAKPCSTAGPTKRAHAVGIFSQMPFLPWPCQASRPRRSSASKRCAGAAAAAAGTSASTPPKRSSFAARSAGASSAGAPRPAASSTHSARRSRASLAKAHMFSSRPACGDSTTAPFSTGPETKTEVKPALTTG